MNDLQGGAARPAALCDGGARAPALRLCIAPVQILLIEQRRTSAMVLIADENRVAPAIRSPPAT